MGGMNVRADDSERGPQLRLEYLHQRRFPADIIVGHIEDDDFIGVGIAEALEDDPPMRLFHNANHIGFFDAVPD